MRFSLRDSAQLQQTKGPCTAASCQEAGRVVRDAMAFTHSMVVQDKTANSMPPSSFHMKNGHDEQHLIRDGDVVCYEIGGKGEQWKYIARQHPAHKTGQYFEIIDLNSKHNPIADLVGFVRSCIVPEGYPDSVSSSYKPYMQWRALKYFFGGAMSVFTTRSLLYAAGVSHGGAASAAVAVNWVIKDGAGRVGKMLSSRHGKKFDCCMKQLRFAGDLLMEVGVGIELATVAAPHLFLPLACAANIAKNVAAVASTSTRAPIYKAFARGENIGDVTAKGECISNIADLLGTGLGIFISARNPSLPVTFLALSCGYLCSSYQEIKSVLLPSLNKSRFRVAAWSFFSTGQVPSLLEGNRRERIFAPPWIRERDIVLGARVKDAFSNHPRKFSTIQSLFQKENYLVTYNSSKQQVYAVLKEKASPDDVLQAAFHAELLHYILQRPLEMPTLNGSVVLGKNSTDLSVEATISETCKHISSLYGKFRHEALSKGWFMTESLLCPVDSRLRSVD